MIDLYSDTKTHPTVAMRAAMAAADVGDEQADEDPTTLALCRRVAALLDMAAGVFMPSGTLCNLAAILVHTRPGDELICEQSAHLATTEAASAAVVGGVQLRTLATPGGIFTPEQVRGAIRPVGRTAPRTAVLSVEQTTFAAGAVWPLDTLQAVRAVAADAGLRTHIDGARLLNACAVTGIAAADYCRDFDSAWIDLSKGLGCPVGAVLCGSETFVQSAWQWKYRLGGAMRQSGILAAAGLHALDRHVDGLRSDHEHAVLIWQTLSANPLFRFDPARPDTNMLRFSFDRGLIDAERFVAECLRQGVRVRAVGDNRVRVTTHLDVTRAQALEAAQVMLSVAVAAQG